MSIHRSLFLLILALATATGQQPSAAPPAVVATAPPGVPVPGTPPGPAATGAPIIKPTTRPSSQPTPNTTTPNPAIPLGNNQIVEDIIEKKLSGEALAGLYRRYTGRRVIVSSAAATAEFSFVQEASQQDPLTFAKAAELLKKAATIENFVFVPDEQDPNLDILTLASAGIRPTGRGVDVYNENSQLPDGDAVISYVMSLSYIKPAEAVNTFTQIIGQLGAFGSIAAVPNASAVVITENTSLIRKLIDLKKEIDKPSSQVATRFIKVQFADVTELATLLTTLLTAQQTTQKTAGVQRADAPQAPPGGAPAQATGGSTSGEETPVQIVPEPRTNRIFAMGRPVDLLFVEGLVREFDVQTSDKIFLRRKLRFLAVSDFLPIASDALTRAFSGTTEGSAKPASAANKAGSAQSNNRSSASNNNNSRSSRTSGSSSGMGSSGSSFGGSSGSSFGGGSYGSSGSSGSGSSLSAPAANAAPESVLVGRTLLVADNITNTIVAQGPPSGLEIIEKLLDQIDVKPDQVMISTVIGSLSLKDDKDLGVGYFFHNANTQVAGSSFPFIPVPSNSGTVTNTLYNPIFDPTAIAGGGLRMYGKIGNVDIFLKALQSRTDFTVLSRPSIFTSNNQKGTISSGQRIAIPTGTNSYGGTSNGGSTQIQYQDVVLKLEVIPLVNSKREITMQISLLNDQKGADQVIEGGGPNGTPLTVPGINTQEIITTATVPNNETIVLGGLISGSLDKEKSGIPILSDIPYLGKLFSSTTNHRDRSELMIFIQPSIVNSDRSLKDVQTAMDDRYKVSPDARKFSDNYGVLPGIDDIPRLDQPVPAHAPPSKAVESTKAVIAPNPAPHSISRMKPSIRPADRQ